RITITNNSANSDRQVQLRIAIPNNMTLATNPSGPVAFTIDGQTVTFSPILELRPNEPPLNFDLRLRANSPGPAQVTAEVRSLNSLQPLTRSETVTINPQ